MDSSAFEYDLPPGSIAQHPLEVRDAARLLVDRGPEGAAEHRTVRELADLLEPGDLVVVNTTRVLPARLALRRATGGSAEVLLLEPTGRSDSGSVWEALVRPSRKIADGAVLTTPDGASDLVVIVGADLGEGRRSVELHTSGDELDALARHGVMPLPPYITERLEDPSRYQTVFAERPASAAAPTAGLHLTAEVFERLAARGVGRADVELVVGLGTFRPIAADRIEDHVMHAEAYNVPEATMEACIRTF